MDLHNEFYSQIRENNHFEELLTVRNDNENVTVFGAMDDNVIKEMLVLVGGDDNALIYVRGEISPELINEQIDFSHPDKFMSFNF